jgi:hypothetical protein
MLCVHPKTLAGAEETNAKFYIIRNPQRVWSCWRGDNHMIVIAALPAPVRYHRKSTTDFVFTGSCLAPEIMSTSHNQFIRRSRLVLGFRDNSLLLFSIIGQTGLWRFARTTVGSGCRNVCFQIFEQSLSTRCGHSTFQKAVCRVAFIKADSTL